MKTGEELLRLENISKTFPGVQALKNININIKSGEIHGLVGENGAGKSTLIKILTGAHQKDDGGQIWWKGKPVEIHNPDDAKKYGVGVVYQEIMMSPHLSVGENFFMGNLPNKNGVIDWRQINSSTMELLDRLEISVDPRTKIKDLPVALQEMVSIAKIVYDKASLVIFDEPTALLTNEEVDILFRIIKNLTQEGCGVIYISHRMEEIFKICDCVTVLKDGCYIDTLPVTELDESKLISLMVGRKLEDLYNISHVVPGEIVLEVRQMSAPGKYQHIDFNVRSGEIVGFYGLVGSGRTEIMKGITGAEPFANGEIYLNQKEVTIKNPQQSKQFGIAFLTEDRKNQGLGMNLSVKQNINLASYDKISRCGVICLRKEEDRARHYCEDISIKTPSIMQLVKNLSGGNQQKVVISKWLACDSRVFIFDEPTVGVDVAAKREIYLIIESLINKGAAVILISSYLPEVMGLSDRIYVLHEGCLSGIVKREEYMENMDEALMVGLASGLDSRKKLSKVDPEDK